MGVEICKIGFLGGKVIIYHPSPLRNYFHPLVKFVNFSKSFNKYIANRATFGYNNLGLLLRFDHSPIDI